MQLSKVYALLFLPLYPVVGLFYDLIEAICNKQMIRKWLPGPYIMLEGSKSLLIY